MADNFDTDDNKVGFSFTYSLDSDKFFRRSCPKCGLHFKILASADVVTTLIAPAFQQLVSDYESEEQDETGNLWTCPYCRHQDEPQNFITEEMLNLVRNLVYREYMLPKIEGMFDEIGEQINQTGRRIRSQSRKSLFSIDIKFSHDEQIRSPRPIVGPELPDMNKVDLLCCHNQIKIKAGWYSSIYCPYCSHQLKLC